MMDEQEAAQKTAGIEKCVGPEINAKADKKTDQGIGEEFFCIFRGDY
jgi:hypothetical protein